MKHLVIPVVFVIGLYLAGCGSERATAVSAGDSFAFDPATMTLPANAAATVTFENNAGSLQHNWVLVNGDDTVAVQVNEAAQSAPNYIPEGPQVLAASQLLSAGQQDNVSVPVLQASTYMYICTFPGHYQSGMKGTLTTQ